jgi:hypothetical protein
VPPPPEVPPLPAVLPPLPSAPRPPVPELVPGPPPEHENTAAGTARIIRDRTKAERMVNSCLLIRTGDGLVP